MAANLVIDVSVVIAAVSPSEKDHKEALDFLQRAHASHAVFHEPPQCLFELYSVLTRRPRELRQLGFMSEEDPMVLKWTPLAEPQVQRLLEWLTSNSPGKCPTRGADLAYLSSALEAKLPLVTLDTGLQSFGVCGLDICAPKEFIDRL